MEVHASGFADVRGLAFDRAGALHATDRELGTVTRVGPDHSRTVVASGLAHPVGLGLDARDRPVVAEERAGRVVRIEATGPAPLITGVRRPRWVAVHADGTVFVAARRPTREVDPEPDDDAVEPDTILALNPAGRLATFDDGFRRLQGLAVDRDGLLVASAGRRHAPHAGAGIVRIPILADGTAGIPVPLGPADAVKRPVALVVDGLGAVYVSAGRRIAKIHPDGTATAFAERLSHPQGVALDAEGHLYVADGRGGHVLRFLAPPPPVVDVPAASSGSPLGLTGATEPGARVDVLAGEAPAPVSALADPAGRFRITLDLPATAAGTIRLRLFATGHAGLGLTSAPAEITLTLDGTAPALSFDAPPSGTHVRQTVRVEVRASDSGGIQTLSLAAGRQALPATLAPAPPAPAVVATAAWATTAFADGAHTLGATARDRAGNETSTSRVVIVDNTAPETEIADGPDGDTAGAASATFALGGSDNLTPGPSLVFAWRLDAGAWSPFSGATTTTLVGLAEGAHTLEAVARDLAGNEDPTPAVRRFTVSTGPVITGIAPAAGPVGTLLSLTGSGFEPGLTQVTIGGAPAFLRTVTATGLTLAVPPGAVSGPLVVTTPLGTASAPFAVSATGDFTLAAAPAPPARLRVIAGDAGATAITVRGTGRFGGLVGLAVSGLPPGVSDRLAPPQVAPGGTASLGLAVAGSVPPGVYTVTVTGDAEVDGRRVSRTVLVALEVLPADTAAVTGRVLTADPVPQPLPGVTVTLGTAFALTDAAGNFTLLAPPAGTAMLLVDGRTASTPGAQYPPVEINLTVNAAGPTPVPFPIYLPALDTAHPITLPLDAAGFTTATVDASTPRLPGLVVTVPARTRIIGPDGNPVSQITITPVPVDRSPMPFPPAIAPPMLFTLQPGGAVPSQPLPITFTNPRLAPPGSRADLYFFDLVAGAWATWGQGRVNADGARVVPDPGAGLPRFAWHFACGEDCSGAVGEAPPADNQPAPTGGDPVDLFTGRLVVQKTDLLLPGRIPLRIQRSHWSGATEPGPFGLGWALAPWDARLVAQGAALVLVQADRSRLLWLPDGPGRWVNRSAPYMLGAVLTQRPGDFLFQIRLADGTVHLYDRVVGFSDVATLRAVVDRNGNAVTIDREGQGPGRLGRIARITESAGRQLLLTHDEADRIVTVTDPIGRVVRYAYDAHGRLERVIDPAGGVTTHAYDGQHRIVTITDPRGISFLATEYDPASGRVVRQVQGDGGVWRFDYATLGTLGVETTVTDPRGHTTVHRFDPRGFRLGLTDALGLTTSVERDPGTGLPQATIDPLGRRTSYTHDERGNVTAVTDPEGHVRAAAYEPVFNRLVATTDPLGQVTHFEHDARGNLSAIVDPLGQRTTVAHDGAGQPVAVTDALGHTTTYGHDAHGNLASVVDPLGHATTREYDLAGRLVRLVDARGAVTRFAHDPLGRVTAVTDPLGGVTRFVYDASGNLLTVTDALGGTTTYTYDAMDRVASRTDPSGATETFAHDAGGHLVRHTDRKGQTTTFEVDALGRRVATAFADGTAIRLAYDASGQLALAEDDREGAIVNAYDTLGRLVRQASPLGAVEYAHDPLGRRTRMQAPGEPPVEYAWDAASRLTAIAQGARVVAFEHDAAGRRTRVTRPGPITTDYAWDAASRLTGVAHHGPAGPLGDLTYAHDVAGNRTAAGGSLARVLLPDPIASATYDAASRAVTFGGTALAHDANGNLLTDGPNAYAWDARGRLVAVTGPTVTAAFAYDALGRRAARTLDGGTTVYLHDGLNPLQEIPASAPPATLLAGLALDEFLLRADAAGTRALLTDALGSVLAEVGDDGTVLAEHVYAPFGATASSGLTGNPFRFTGREQDTPDLYYYRARYYHPRLGRFLSEDPLSSTTLAAPTCGIPRSLDPNLNLDVDPGLAPLLALGYSSVARLAPAMAFDPRLLGQYIYANNDPVNRVDPTGFVSAPQNPGCDRFPDFNPCTTACCNEHDRCFTAANSRCDESTWLDFVRRARRARTDCMDCNLAAVRCVARSLTQGGRKPCGPTAMPSAVAP